MCKIIRSGFGKKCAVGLNSFDIIPLNVLLQRNYRPHPHHVAYLRTNDAILWVLAKIHKNLFTCALPPGTFKYLRPPWVLLLKALELLFAGSPREQRLIILSGIQ
jgi:hypothetical protein